MDYSLIEKCRRPSDTPFWAVVDDVCLSNKYLSISLMYSHVVKVLSFNMFITLWSYASDCMFCLLISLLRCTQSISVNNYIGVDKSVLETAQCINYRD